MTLADICWPAISAAVLYVTVLVAITTVAFKARSWGDVRRVPDRHGGAGQHRRSHDRSNRSGVSLLQHLWCWLERVDGDDRVAPSRGPNNVRLFR